MKHEMGLQSKYFDYIKNGTKRIELRLFDEKRRQINIGDTIEFANPDGEKLLVKVLGFSGMGRLRVYSRIMIFRFWLMSL
ncbi:hypothetical protein IKD98_01090 [Candidatus Saccharibacteria bacterium]|nr:hypothetical protein [Candidatus Saccharibacteria bacterium]